jgi:hypothetical protein
MRNPERGHTKPFAKTLAPGLLFCHVGNCQVLSTANQNLKEGPLSSGFFCFWAVYFLGYCWLEEKAARRGIAMLISSLRQMGDSNKPTYSRNPLCSWVLTAGHDPPLESRVNLVEGNMPVGGFV